MNRELSDRSLLRTAAYIDGQWIEKGEHGRASLYNPSTGELLAELPQMGKLETASAIEAAHRALGSWRVLPAKARSRVLRRWFDLIVENTDDLARIIVMEEGKPFSEAKGEIAYGAAFIEWFAEEAKRVRGDIIAANEVGRRVLVLKEPVGVCAAITPWNFPAAMITRKAGPALAAGCTMVLKPAEQTPLTALALAVLAERAGVPKGVFNVVIGPPREIGAELTSNHLVRKVTFTGSTEVGRLLIAQSAATVKKVSMELGGNAPFIVFDDANLDAAVAGALASKYRNTGQACISANRIFVQEGIYASFAERLATRVEQLVVGDGFADDVQQGPLIDQDALAKVQAHVADAVSRGAKVLLGGAIHARGGLFFQPTVLTDVGSESLLMREETFGPIAPLVRFRDEDEVIRLANDTEYGLAAYVFTSDAARIWRVCARLESGMVGVNTGFISSEVAPFGGVKQSGLGREGSHYGIEEYLEIKYLAWEGAGEK